MKVKEFIQRAKWIALSILSFLTILYPAHIADHPYTAYTIHERPIIFDQPKLRLRRYSLLLTDRHESEPAKEFKVICRNLHYQDDKSFCDRYRYHMGLVKVLRAEGIHVYTDSPFKQDDLIIRNIIFVDPYDGQTKVIALSGQEILNWQNYFVNERVFWRKVYKIIIIIWGIYFIYFTYLFLRMIYRKKQKKKLTLNS
ncbi:hypothetical protein PT286_02570 [Neisseriaceae bacterium ESL0693]|nr:hypothetical protein [Neisseriaceae bacterium ESL0693]